MGKEARERHEKIKAELKVQRKVARNKANRDYDEAIRKAKQEMLEEKG